MRRLPLLALPLLAVILLAGAPRPLAEWTGHRSEDSANPTPEEQEMLALANRARSDPAAEGVWLTTDPFVQARFGAFPIDWQRLRDEFAALPPRPPVAFDARILAGEDVHALYMLETCTQTHSGQRARVEAAGFDADVHRVVAWVAAETPLWGHAGFQIDFGGPASEGGMQPGRPHRAAIHSATTHAGYAMLEGDRRSCQPDLSASGSFATPASSAEPARFLVGTVYVDANANGRFDAGEGLGGVRVDLTVGPWYAITAPAGGYAVPLPDTTGEVFVAFQHGETTEVRGVELAGESVLLDWRVAP